MSKPAKKTSVTRPRKSSPPPALWSATWAKPVLTAVFLVLLTSFAAYNKLSRLAQNPRFSVESESCAFWTESAFHYRYAEMVARGRAIPERDTRAQVPESVAPLENFTIAMEYAAGYTYRLLGSVFGIEPPLHKFVAWFDCLFSSLSITALFFLALLTWRSRAAAGLAASWYAVAPPSFARTASGAFLREDFALPLIFGALAFMVYSSEKEKAWARWSAGALFALALASWHVSPFLLFLLSLFAAYVFIASGRNRQGYLKSFSVLIICSAAAGIVFPVLRAKFFIFSLPMLTAYCVLAAALLEKKWPMEKKSALFWMLAAALPLAWIAGTWLASARTAEFSHVYLLILDKLRFLGVKPGDPTVMSFHSKILWLSAFNSPSKAQILAFLGIGLWLALAMAVELIRDWFKGRLDIPGKMALIFFLVFGVSYLAIDRMSVFFGFFSALILGSLAYRRSARACWIALSLGLLVIATDYYRSKHYRILAYRPGNDLHVVEWLKSNTGRDDTILAPFQWGPSILAYAGRPIVLHSKFESSGMREKVRDFLAGLYGGVDEMLELCRGWNVRYLLYTRNLALDSGPSSYRYVMNRQESLPEESTAYAFQYAPESLDEFRLAYQDATTRIFEVGANWDTLSARIYRENYHPLWDLNLIGKHSDRAVSNLRGKLRRPDFHLAVAEHYAGEDPEIARQEYNAAIRLGAANAKTYYRLAEVLLHLNRSREAVKALERALAYDPQYDFRALLDSPPEVLSSLGGLLLGKNRWEDAEVFLERALEQESGIALGLNNLGLVRMRQERFIEARELFERSIEVDSTAASPRLNLGILLLQQDDPRAVEELREYLRLVPGAPKREAIMRSLREKGWI